jgi:hypothetical protein
LPPGGQAVFGGVFITNLIQLCRFMVPEGRQNSLSISLKIPTTSR